MIAETGDRIVVQGTRLDEHVRDGEILEVRGPRGAPPYLVRWSDDGHVSLFFPGPTSSVKPTQRHPAR